VDLFSPTWLFIGVVALIFLVLFIVLGVILTKLYTRASKERAFVRTGAGGQKVVKDGGAVVLPVFHEIIQVNMTTLRLEVHRKGPDALITKDRLRVDVGAAFFVRVKPDADAIATAAQTLGQRTMDRQGLATVIEDKFVDALRSVAAGMEMQDLHEKRAQFVQAVQNTLDVDLAKNGLELEAVSLTSLDQTDSKYFNPNNAFDAEGLAKLAEVVQDRLRHKNDVEQASKVAIAQRNLEANRKELEIKREQQQAQLEQERTTETLRAEQEADLAKQRAERKREADLVTIQAEQATEEARVNKVLAVQQAETKAARDLEIAQADQRIAVATKSQEQSQAQAKADTARAQAVTAAEAVKTAEAEAKAEREKRVALIAAEQEAEKSATGIRVRAQAEFEAASQQAQSRILLAEADQKAAEAEAAGKRAINAAANDLGTEAAELQVKLATIEALPRIMEQMVAPMKSVSGVRIVHVNGMGGAANGGAPASQSFAGDLATSMLQYRAQLPLVDALAREVGIDLDKGLNGVVDSVGGKSAAQQPVTDQPAADTLSGTSRGDDLPAEAREMQTLAGIRRS
jgi:uncharacterized membrane protein YqiK